MRTGARSFQRLVERFGSQVDFVFVYILEAHASDEWPMPIGVGKMCLPATKTVAERAARAAEYAKEYALPSAFRVLVDLMGNSFATVYACWPERFFVFDRDRIAFIGSPVPDAGHCPAQLELWLEYNESPPGTVPPILPNAIWPSCRRIVNAADPSDGPPVAAALTSTPADEAVRAAPTAEPEAASALAVGALAVVPVEALPRHA
eukprot:c39392_g1_i1.p2 GENE.c39392_g1_i1~~c39392_g1_i1.p2  ORF type:complete len:205 (-),score=27.02 c39392_g1_i1:231-845(-)